MSDKITSNEKLEFLYYKSQNLAITDLDANLQKDIFLENKNYIFSDSVLAESIPSIADINVDASLSTFKLSQNDLFNYQDSISLKKDINNIVLKVTQLKLQKIPNSDTGWYYLDASKNNFLTPLIPPNYKSTDNGSNAPYQVKIYSEKGLERVKNNTAILTNELLRSCDYIFDYENGILLLAKDCKDANGELISTDNPPYISFYKYIGARGKANTLDGQWLKDNNDIYYDSGAVIIGNNTKISSDQNKYNLEISGNVYISNKLCVKGKQIIRDDLHIIDAMDISGNLTVEGKSFFKDDVSGNDATFNKITIDGDLIVDGKTSITDISGADASFNNVDIDGNLTVDGKTTIKHISGADASFNNVDVCGNKLNAKNIYITGNLYQNGNIFSTTNAVNKIGQSFFEIITQQPSQFEQVGDISKNSTEIKLSWGYDNILATLPNKNLAKLSFQSATNLQNLPHISQIQVDISGVVDSSHSDSNKFINYDTFTIGNSDDYTSPQYKKLTIPKTSDANKNDSYKLNILSKQNPFDIRIYGINNAVNYPSIDDRALVFKNLVFIEGKVPAKPIFVRENPISNNDQLSYVYKVEETENGNSSSQALIISAISDASQNITLSSSIYPVDPSVFRTVKSLSNIGSDTNFDLSLTNLRAGTKYNYKVQVKNNIKDGYSEFSTQQLSNFLRLPGDNSVNTTLDFSQNNSEIKISVTTPNSTANLNNNSVFYKNIDQNNSFTFKNINNQIIQITKPYNDNQQTEIKGYGVYVDNSSNLVTIECLIDTTLKQKVEYNGFNTSNKTAGTSTRSTNSFNFFGNYSQEDIWESNNNKKGFRIKGNFQLNNISDLGTNIGEAKSTKYTLKYKYTRHEDVGGAPTNTTEYNIYIDYLPNDPSISSNLTTSATVKSVIYTMGIPSVKTMDIDFERTYENINSEQEYLPGNLIIAEVTSIQRVNVTPQYIKIDRGSIDNTGEYTYNSNGFKTATNDYYTNKYYNLPVGVGDDNNTTLNVNEKVYSLRGSNSITNQLSVDHHFDKDSYNSYGVSSINRKLSATDFYEISDSTNDTNIAKLGSDVGRIQVSQYTTSNTDSGHQKIPQDWTLLYYNGAFRTNASITYPNVNNYEWNSIVTIGSQYSAGTESYNLSGAPTTDDSGYKWIVFNITKSTGGYNMMGLTLPIDQNGDNYPYLNLKSALSNFFQASTIDSLLASDNSDAIGFCRATKSTNSGDIIIMGSFKQTFNPIGGNWIVNGSGTVSYSQLVSNSSFGAIVEDGSKGKGIYISKTAINDDLKIFIGLKNDQSQ